MVDPPTPSPNKTISDIVVWVWLCFMVGTLLHLFSPIPGTYGTTIEGLLIGGAIAYKVVKILDRDGKL